MSAMIQVSTQITQRDFIRFNYAHFFRKPLIILFTILLGLLFTLMLLSSILIVATGYEGASLFDQLMPLLILSGIFGLTCWSVYYQSKRNYATTKTVHEPITYTFTEAGILAKGSSFESNLKWDALHKVQETKSWFAFYQGNQTVGLVSKTSFQGKDQVQALRVLIASQHNLKHKLRKD